ncbi:hypothetical protein [Halioxenophilus aromaticivorans]|uniref:DUF4840 domain-containing protein n=1 Tax=Halioxenophilus aromaticivorans TaxID=1306992 RepID=A0AAV3TX97_9ALTE
MKKLIIFLVFIMCASQANGCEEFVSYEPSELKEYRDLLSKVGADPIDRLFAFEKLVCSDKPIMRTYAVKVGLETTDNELVRNQIMLSAMMQKKRIDIELFPNKTATDLDKKFIQTHDGIYSVVVTYYSEKEGCLGLHGSRECKANYSLIIKGDKAEFKYGNHIGWFDLTSSGELVGVLKAGMDARYSSIPAKISLY